MSWTHERIETLKKLWADGHSASQIAAELGGITRNAVVGKVHRLGVSGRAKSPAKSPDKSSSPAAPRARKRRSASRMLSGRGTTARARELDDAPEPELLDNFIPLGQRRNLIELGKDTCRWPLGDPDSADFFFCGGPTIASLPYCSHHSRLAYQSAKVRSNRRLARVQEAD
jgi:GcrA cell cycle regulator